jgi:hypothetical protein
MIYNFSPNRFFGKVNKIVATPLHIVLSYRISFIV